MEKTAFQFDTRTGDYIGPVQVKSDDEAHRLARVALRESLLAAPAVARADAAIVFEAAQEDFAKAQAAYVTGVADAEDDAARAAATEDFAVAEALHTAAVTALAQALADYAEAEAEADQAAEDLDLAVWLLPTNATFIELPEPVAGHGAKWDGEGWLSLPDHRGEIWYDAEAMGFMLYHLNQEVELGLSADAPTDKVLAQEAELMRGIRLDRLVESDVLVLPDRWAAYSDDKRAAIATYRQALRDVPNQDEFPYGVVWPMPPA